MHRIARRGERALLVSFRQRHEVFRGKSKAAREIFDAEYFKSLQGLQTESDVFTTGNSDFAKAFRVGGCKVVEPSKTNVEVLLFWKTDTRSEQKAINVEVIKQNDKWLINKILN